LIAHLAWVARHLKGALVIDSTELDQLKLVEHGDDLVRAVNAMRVEARPLNADGARKEQLPTGSEHALKFRGRLGSPPWIERVAVPTEAHVFSDVKAR
jgi:hypothetical protein